MLLLQRHADILPLRMPPRVLVVSYVAALGREDAVVSSEFAVLTGEPCCAPLAEDNVAGDDVFACEESMH